MCYTIVCFFYVNDHVAIFILDAFNVSVVFYLFILAIFFQ